jgi:hypothetical protein
MHDIDRTQVGGSNYEMENEAYEMEGDDGEAEQDALAAELMELETEEEFENFLLKILRSAAGRIGGYINSQTGRSVGSLLKGAARQLLADPTAGNAPQDGAGEYEAPYDQGEEEQDWEAARTFVRLADEAGKIAAQTPPDAPPEAVANSAVTQAAQVHAPSLLTPPSPQMMAPPPLPPPRRFPGPMGPYGRRRSGRWIRRGNQILLLGV